MITMSSRLSVPVTDKEGKFTGENILVYSDNRDCYTFYALRTRPRLTGVDEGNPKFSAKFWSDVQNGNIEAVNDVAGGQIDFEVNLGLSQEEHDKVIKAIKDAKLAQVVFDELKAEESDRMALRKRIEEAQDKASSTLRVQNNSSAAENKANSAWFGSGTGARKRVENENAQDKTANNSSEKVNLGTAEKIDDSKIRLTFPEFNKSTINFVNNGGDTLVSWTSSGSNASNRGSQNAVVSTTLTPMGAKLMSLLLMGESVDVDLSIQYNISYDYCLPSLEIKAWAGDVQTVDIEKTIERFVDTKSIGKWEIYRKEYSEVTELSKALTELGLINVEITKRTSKISQDDEFKLKEQIISVLTQKMSTMFVNQMSGMTEEERKSKYFSTFKDVVSSFTEVHYKQNDVLETTYSPQGLIQEFLGGVDDTKKYVKLIDLNHETFKRKKINVDVSAMWDSDPTNVIDAVYVDLFYPKANERKSYKFTKDHTSEVWQFTRPDNDDDEIEYSYSVSVKGIGIYEFPKVKTKGYVLINVAEFGLLKVNFRPHNKLSNFSGDNEINSIVVNLWYDEPNSKNNSGKKIFEDTLVIPTNDDGEFQTIEYKRNIGRPVTGKLHYKFRYSFENLDDLETNEYSAFPTTDILILNPFPNPLNIRVMPGFEPGPSVKAIYVDFKYNDVKNKFNSLAFAQFTKLDDEWDSQINAEIAVKDTSISSFMYKFRVVTKDDILISEWINGSGEAETITLPVRKVSVGTKQLGLGTENYMGEVRITSSDGVVNRTISLTEEEKDKVIDFYVFAPEKGERIYTYETCLTDYDGNENRRQDSTDSSTITLKNPKPITKVEDPHHLYIQVYPDIPVEEIIKNATIDIKYEDKAHNYEVAEKVVLELNENNEWPTPVVELTVEDSNYKTYKYKARVVTTEGTIVSDWIENTTNDSLELKVNLIKIGINALKIGVDNYMAELHVTSDDGVIDKNLSLTPDNCTSAIISFPAFAAEKGKTRTLNYDLTVIDMDGNEHKGNGSTTNNMIVLKNPVPPVPQTPTEPSEKSVEE